MAASFIKGVTAWQNNKEWELVYEELYSEDPQSQKHAVDKIGMWWTRFGERLSSGLINSYELMSALLEMNGEGHCEITRKNLAAAIVRFVSFTTDKKQTNVHARSTLAIAKSMEIPEWLVELRHGAAHQGALPSLRMLVHGAKVALRWLKTNYWEAQNQGRGGDRSSLKRISKQTKILEKILMEYMQTQFDIIQGNTEMNESISLILDEFHGLVSDRDGLGLLDVTMDLLCQEGHLIPTDEQLESFGLTGPESATSNNCGVPEQLLQLWRPLLDCISRMGFIVDLLKQLADTDIQEGSATEAFVMGWLYYILNLYGSTEDPENPEEVVKLNVHDVILKLLNKPNKYTSPTLELAWNLEHHFSQDQQEALSRVVKLVNCEDLPEQTDRISDKIFYARDFISNNSNAQNAESFGAEDKERETAETVTEGIRVERERTCTGWQLADDTVPWGRYPIGTCPNYTDGNPCSLELYGAFPSINTKGVNLDQSDSDHSVYESEEEEVDMECQEDAEPTQSEITNKEVDKETVSSQKNWSKEEMSKLKMGIFVI